MDALNLIKEHLQKWGGVGTISQISKGTKLSEETVASYLKKYGIVVRLRKGWRPAVWKLDPSKLSKPSPRTPAEYTQAGHMERWAEKKEDD